MGLLGFKDWFDKDKRQAKRTERKRNRVQTEGERRSANERGIDYDDDGGPKGNFDYAGAATSAIKAAPGIVAAFQSDHSDVDSLAEYENESSQDTMSLTASGAQIGFQAGGLWGGLAGGLAGFASGRLKESSGLDGALNNMDEKEVAAMEKVNEQRLQNYYETNSAERMKIQYELMQKQEGLIT